MQHIQLRDAKAQLSAVIDAAQKGEAAVITRHGKPAAVVLGYDEWQRLSKVPSFGWLLANSPLTDEDLPPREPWESRDIEA
jgi:prevent-host-death family protein